MKTMKKKVVALLTLAMFVMTMLPVAAFAAPGDPAVPENSRVSFDIDKTNPTIDTDEVLVVEAHMFADKYDKNPNSMADTAIWVEDENGKKVNDAVIDMVNQKDEFTGAWQMENGYPVVI